MQFVVVVIGTDHTFFIILPVKQWSVTFFDTHIHKLKRVRGPDKNKHFIFQ